MSGTCKLFEAFNSFFTTPWDVPIRKIKPVECIGIYFLWILLLKNTSNYDEKIYVRFGSSIPLSFCSSLIFEDKTFSGSGRVSINGSFNVTDLFSNP